MRIEAGIHENRVEPRESERDQIVLATQRG